MSKILKLYFVLFALNCQVGFAGSTVGGGGPPAVSSGNALSLRLNTLQFRQVLMRSFESNEIDLNGEKFAPGAIDLENKTIILHSNDVPDKTVELGVAPGQ